MRFDDIRKLATGNILFDLRRIISPRLVTIAYLLGLAAIALWAVNHFFFSFRFGFGNGLWGLLEIAVFGLLALIILRIVCEGVIVYFKAHESEAAQIEVIAPLRPGTTLIDDVRDAIEELADREPELDEPETPPTAAAVVPDPAPEAVAPAPPKKRGRPAKPKAE